MSKTINSVKENLLIVSDSVEGARSLLRSSIDELRSLIEQLKLQRNKILRDVPVTPEFAKARAGEWFDQVLSLEEIHLGCSSLPPQRTPSPEDFIAAPSQWGNLKSNVGVILARYLRDNIIENIMDEAKVAYDNASFQPITEDEREKRLAGVERELLDAEMSEESLIRVAKRNGFNVGRRKDADPRALQASDGDLP